MNNLLEKMKKYKNATGYIRYLSKKLNKEDIFFNKNLQNFEFDGIPLEVVFFDEKEKVSFKAILVNDRYLIDEVKIDNFKKENVDIFYSVFEGIKVKMYQIWEKEKDTFEEEFEEKVLKKVVFIGFEGEIK